MNLEVIFHEHNNPSMTPNASFSMSHALTQNGENDKLLPLSFVRSRIKCSQQVILIYANTCTNPMPTQGSSSSLLLQP